MKMEMVETIEPVTAPGKQSSLGRRIARGLPHGLFLLACAVAGIAAQHYQPDLAILDVMAAPKWAEAVGGISFLVVLFGGLTLGWIHAVLVSFLMLLSHPWFSFMTSIVRPDGDGSSAAPAVAQLADLMITSIFPLFSAVVPLLVALGVLTELFGHRKAPRGQLAK